MNAFKYNKHFVETQAYKFTNLLNKLHIESETNTTS